eukprot:4491000-Pyramimonas_sp.AAC.1
MPRHPSPGRVGCPGQGRGRSRRSSLRGHPRQGLQGVDQALHRGRSGRPARLQARPTGMGS